MKIVAELEAERQSNNGIHAKSRNCFRILMRPSMVHMGGLNIEVVQNGIRRNFTFGGERISFSSKLSGQ